ncbi:MAG: repeat protein [Planctomycetaceae bacterium]|nr:repeat protein [Planctomycetaceae bacterium]
MPLIRSIRVRRMAGAASVLGLAIAVLPWSIGVAQAKAEQKESQTGKSDLKAKAKTNGIQIEFRWAEPVAKEGLTEPEGVNVSESGRKMFLHKKPILTNQDTATANAVKNKSASGDLYYIDVNLTKDAAKRMAKSNEENLKKSLVVLADGKIISALTPMQSLSDWVLVYGPFTKAEADRIATSINTKPVAVPGGEPVAEASGQELRKADDAKKEDGQAAGPVMTFRGHATEVTSLAFDSNGTQVISSSEKDVCIWDPATGKEIRRLKVDGDSVVGFSRDFSRLAIARSFHFDVPEARRGKLTLQETANGSDVWSIDAHGNWDRNFPFRPSIAALAFSPDGKWLATAGSVTKVGGPHGMPGGVVKIWNIQTGQEFQQLGPLSTRVETVVFSADGKYLAVGTGGASGELPEPGELHVWNTTTFQRVHSFRTRSDVEQGGNPGSVMHLAFHPKGVLLAAAVTDGTVRLWELPSGHELLELRGHQGQSSSNEIDKFTGRIIGRSRAVRTVAFSPDGSRLASAGYDRVVREWDTLTGEQTRTFSFISARINAVAFSPDGQRVAAAGSNAAKSGEVVIWQLSDKPEKLSGTILSTLRKAEIAKNELESRSQIETAVKSEEAHWKNLDAAQRGIRDRVVKVLIKTMTLSDSQVASAVYLLSLGRSPTVDELKLTQKDFAESKDRPLSILQLIRGLVQSNEFKSGLATTSERLFKIQRDLATKRGTGEIPVLLTSDGFQKLTGDFSAAVAQAAKTDEQFVDLVYLLAYSRFPTTTESNQLVTHLKKAPDHAAATKEIFVFLLNTKEFLVTP